MMDVLRKRAGCLFFGTFTVVGILMAILFPAGRDAFVAYSHSLSVKGQMFAMMMAKNDRLHKAGENYINPDSFSNSCEFLTSLCKTYELDSECACSLTNAFRSWNVAVCDLDMCGASFPLLISSNIDLENMDVVRLTANELLPICKDSYASEPRLNGKGIVVIRKNGTSSIIKAKHCTLTRIIGDDAKPQKSFI
ncbi:MAG: hypothetical protein IKF72_14955 [Kiritimatiellae bacterium]|nr:hypothetical protein [Kiritimatiellia bacterium]